MTKTNTPSLRYVVEKMASELCDDSGIEYRKGIAAIFQTIADQRPRRSIYSNFKPERKKQMKAYKQAQKEFDSALRFMLYFSDNIVRRELLQFSLHEILLMCDGVSGVKKVMSKEGVHILMKLSGDKNDQKYEFLFFGASHGPALTSKELPHIRAERPKVLRTIARLEREIKTFADANGFPAIYDCFFQPASEPTNHEPYCPDKAPVSVSGSKFKSKKMQPVVHYETFDEGRSVWTMPNNWGQ
jgi:hypothetical protein